MIRFAPTTSCAALVAAIAGAASVATSAPVSRDASRVAAPSLEASASRLGGGRAPAFGPAAAPTWTASGPPREARAEAPFTLGTPFDAPPVGTSIGRPIGGPERADAIRTGDALRPVPHAPRPRPCEPSPQCLSRR